ncbi:MAG TPA: hypothetical protein VKH43_03355 [Thermoanaerobaculia bacterium]|nr:hypothetical protein [Thermoanaerobaculia bacterium]
MQGTRHLSLRALFGLVALAAADAARAGEGNSIRAARIPSSCPWKTPVSSPAFGPPLGIGSFATIAWGPEGNFIAGDVIGDRLLTISPDGSIVKSLPLNLFVTNVAVAANSVYFNAFDRNGWSNVGRIGTGGGPPQTEQLVNGFLDQGAALAVRPDGIVATVSASRAEAWVLPKTLTPFTKASLGAGNTPVAASVLPDGNFSINYNTPSGGGGVKVVTPEGAVRDGPLFPTRTGAAVVCATGVWYGGVNFVYIGTIKNGVATATVSVSTPFGPIFSFSCTADNRVAYVAQGRNIGLMDASGAIENYTVPGSGEFIGVAVAPGNVPSGFVLELNNGQAKARTFQLPGQFAADPNSSSCRVDLDPLSVINR